MEEDRKTSLIKRYSFEEFRLVFESAEKVTDRRISLNKFNYSICTAIFIAIALLWNWALNNPQFYYAGLFVAMILSLVALMFTFYWSRQIKDYKLLNDAKFQVLNKMAKRLSFQTSPDDSNIVVSSFDPFTKEWQYLKKSAGLSNQRYLKIIALKSSNLEQFIPRTFRIIFLMLSLLSLVAVILNVDGFIESLQGLLILK